MDNKQLSKRLAEEAWSNGDVNVVDELVAPDLSNHDPYVSMFGAGANALKNMINTYRKAFPDLRLSVEHQMMDGDFVVSRWTSTGTHKGEFMGNAPTNKKATVTGITIDRFRNGKISETWSNWDMAGLMMQLGLEMKGGKTPNMGRGQEERRA